MSYGLKIALIVCLAFAGRAAAQFDDDEPEDGKKVAKEVKNPAYKGQKSDDDGGDDDANELAAEQSKEAEAMAIADGPHVRRFHEVVDELLAEFGYDVKMGQINGLKNLSIRKVTVNSALPRSYESYVALLVSERIRENSKIRLISCITCMNKSSRLADGKLVVTSPTTNMAEMDRAASTMGIEYFMDIVMVYHTTHMVLAFQIFNTDTKETVWSRTYNSETIKSRFQRLAVDYSQVKKSRPGEDYVPEFRYAFGLGGAYVPNVTGDSNDEGMMVAHFRGTEKFDNRHSEFGLVLNLYQSTNSTLSSYPTTGGTTDTSTTTDQSNQSTTTKLSPFTSAIGLYMLYAYNFLGAIESYNTTRIGVTGGLGTLLATGYLAGTVRGGVDVYLGRSFSVSIAMLYVASSKVLANQKYTDTPGGVGGEVELVYNF